MEQGFFCEECISWYKTTNGFRKHLDRHNWKMTEMFEENAPNSSRSGTPNNSRQSSKCSPSNNTLEKEIFRL
ncbi:hypothetical protein MFLAVUS_004635 [Mucor flavus]|uniref:C2H2-type domain-containing protein n=1 Tax=Mucor flavus TaxID=439312 RepID=A0ABP9YWJ4_9FUNG